MKRLLVFLAVAVVSVAAVVFLAQEKNRGGSPESGATVAASFYPLAEFAKQVGGDRVDVFTVVPSGAESHEFEPTPQDIARIYSADIFILNGGGLEPWGEAIALELKKKGVAVLRMADSIVLEKDADDVLDPHIWLDPVLAAREVGVIRDALVRLDPQNSMVYAGNVERYLARLSQLDETYRAGLAVCAIRDAVASHAAFGYLARRYGLNVISIAGLSPEEEPSPKRLAEIAEFAREKNIRHIFFETLVSPKIAETIARELGAETLVFNPLEGLGEDEISAGKEYVSVMEENLQNLRRALVCR